MTISVNYPQHKKVLDENEHLQAQVARLEAEVEVKDWVIEGLAELCHLLDKEVKQLGKNGLLPINKFSLDSSTAIIEYFTSFAHAKAQAKNEQM